MIPLGLAVSALLAIGVPLLYGPSFHRTIALGFILLPGVLLLGVGKVLSSGIAGRGYPRYTLYVAAISVPLTLGLYLGLIPPYDAWGAATASSISYALTALVALVFFRRATGIGVRRSLLPSRSDLADYTDLLRLARSWRPIR